MMIVLTNAPASNGPYPNRARRKDMKRKIAIIGKYHEPTGSCDQRISLDLPRWGKRRIFFPWDDTLAFTFEQVEAWAKQHNIVIESYAEIKDDYVFIVGFDQAHKVKKAFGLSPYKP